MRTLQQNLSLILALLLASSCILPAKEKAGARSLSGSKLFIAPMEGNLNGFLAAEIIKRKLPMIVVTEEKEADYILTGSSIKEDDRWYHTVFNGKDKNEGNVQLVAVSEKSVIWAAEAGDRSLFWSQYRRGGQRKVADRIVKQMKEQFFQK